MGQEFATKSQLSKRRKCVNHYITSRRHTIYVRVLILYAFLSRFGFNLPLILNPAFHPPLTRPVGIDFLSLFLSSVFLTRFSFIVFIKIRLIYFFSFTFNLSFIFPFGLHCIHILTTESLLHQILIHFPSLSEQFFLFLYVILQRFFFLIFFPIYFSHSFLSLSLTPVFFLSSSRDFIPIYFFILSLSTFVLPSQHAILSIIPFQLNLLQHFYP